MMKKVETRELCSRAQGMRRLGFEEIRAVLWDTARVLQDAERVFHETARLLHETSRQLEDPRRGFSNGSTTTRTELWSEGIPTGNGTPSGGPSPEAEARRWGKT